MEDGRWKMEVEEVGIESCYFWRKTMRVDSFPPCLARHITHFRERETFFFPILFNIFIFLGAFSLIQNNTDIFTFTIEQNNIFPTYIYCILIN